MNKDDVSRTETLLHTYYRIVHLSQELARIKVRKVTGAMALISNLDSLGGTLLWSILIVLSAILIVYLPTLRQAWANIVILGLGTFIDYVCILLNFGPMYAQMILKIDPADDRWGSEVARLIANSVSLLRVLPLLLLLVLTVGIISYEAGVLLLFLITMINLGTSIFQQIRFTLRNTGDLGNMFGALAGRPNILVRNTEDLTSDIFRALAETELREDQIENLAKLSENDLHRRIVDLETMSIRVAIIAIIITVLFSQQILQLLGKIASVLNDFFGVFGSTASQILGFTGSFEAAFSWGIYVMLWWYLINLGCSLIYQTVSALLFVYFNEYRAAYSLQQALTLLSFTAAREKRPDQETGFVENILKRLIYILARFGRIKT